MDIEELACELLRYLAESYPALLMERFRIDEASLEFEPFDLLEAIGRKRGCVISGGNIDTFRAASLVLDDFRGAKIGKISLEHPESTFV